jgi:hypothetical protein
VDTVSVPGFSLADRMLMVVLADEAVVLKLLFWM